MTVMPSRARQLLQAAQSATWFCGDEGCTERQETWSSHQFLPPTVTPLPPAVNLGPLSPVVPFYIWETEGPRREEAHPKHNPDSPRKQENTFLALLIKGEYGAGCSSVVECLHGTSRALGSIPRVTLNACWTLPDHGSLQLQERNATDSPLLGGTGD